MPDMQSGSRQDGGPPMNGYKIISTAPQGSDEWLQARKGGIGGSDVGALLGVNPWRSALDVWRDKVGMDEGFAGNQRTEWGHRLEPVVRAHYADTHPRTWVDEVPGVLAHPDIPEARASLDGLVNDTDGQRILEIKCTGQSWDQPPDSHVMQVMWYMAVTGIPVADIAVLTRGNDYREFVVEYDPALGNMMLAAVQEWWTLHILAGVMPEVDPVRDRDRLADLWTPDPTLPAAVVGHDLAAQLRDAKAAAAAAKTDLEVVTAQVQIAMQCATAAVDPDGEAVAKWVGSKGRESIDTKALAAVLPDVAAKFMRTGKPGRRFTVNG